MPTSPATLSDDGGTAPDGAPTAVRIKTGLTDLDYSEVLAGLTATDSVLVLPNVAQPAS